MVYIPVDTAVQLIVGPLLDDTDFKSLETGVAYNAAGMSVDLIKSSITGTPTKTDLTLTTGGSQDWIELGNGMYYVEVTAAQNNTEGELQLVGVATGILPFISPKYQVVPVKVFNSLIVGSDNLEVDVEQWLGSTVDAPVQITDILSDGNALTTSSGVLSTVGTINGMSASAKSEVNAEVVDVLKTDTVADLSQTAPPATPTIEQAIMYLYSALRNKAIANKTANEKQFFNDANTLIWKKGITKTANDYTEAEGVSGP